MSFILKRFPPTSAILPVYAVIAVPVFGWTITSWLWKLPSWLNFLRPGEITAIFFYAMITALAESLLIGGFLLLLCFAFPARIFRDHFTVRGSWFAIGLTLSILGNGIWRGITRFTYVEISLVIWSIGSIVLIALLTFLSTRVHLMAWAAEWISDRLTVFLYVLIPLSVLAVFIVFLRNAFAG